MDIIICRIRYPNDPTRSLKVHQHFVGVNDGERLVLYSISSIQGKEYRVFGRDGSINDQYFALTGSDVSACGLRAPSFIDCAKAYEVKTEGLVNPACLLNRVISNDIRLKIEENISKMKAMGKHTIYSISVDDFLEYNPKIRL